MATAELGETRNRRQFAGPAGGAESAKSLCGGGFSSTRTSVAVSARYLPERRYHGTPSQRHESIKSRMAQKVSTSEFFAPPSSTRTSVAVSARYLPERRYHGTPSQRHESIKSRMAQKVSTSEFFATPCSFR